MVVHSLELESDCSLGAMADLALNEITMARGQSGDGGIIMILPTASCGVSVVRILTPMSPRIRLAEPKATTCQILGEFW